jgi:hypothetical protein
MYPLAGKLPTVQLMSGPAGHTRPSQTGRDGLRQLMRRLRQIIVNRLLLGLIARE